MLLSLFLYAAKNTVATVKVAVSSHLLRFQSAPACFRCPLQNPTDPADDHRSDGTAPNLR